jgi:L-ascorbate metabolism protein UlaG (beta-lactamase superfamily)
MLAPMRITKHSHACVRLDDGDRRLLIDPGVWSGGPGVLEDVDDILVTHEHADHVEVEALTAYAARNSSLRVHAPAPVAEMLSALGDAVIIVAPGDTVTAGGFEVAVVGGLHAEIYDGLPGCPNVGYVVDGSVYHPGDALHVPEQRIATLLLPVSGPWLKLSEAIDFVRAVAPERAFPIHDALFSPEGLGLADRWMGMKAETAYERIPNGGSLDV